MQWFRLFLATYLIALLGYTAVTVANHGLNLLPVFFGDIALMAWPGQFNFDFLGFLSLSAIWVAWRHRFNAAGLALAVPAFFGGMAFLCAYLLVQSYRSGGDPVRLLLGEGRGPA